MPIVSPKESSELLKVLESPTSSFGQTLHYYRNIWRRGSDSCFQAACYLLLALEDGILQSPISRYQALHILYNLSKDLPPVPNPFLPFLLQATQDPKRALKERVFIQNLLTDDVSLDNLASLVVNSKEIPDTWVPDSLEELWQSASHRPDKSCLLPSNTDADFLSEIAPHGRLEPPYIRHKLQLMEVQHGEVPWQHMQLPRLLRWDASMAQNHVSLKELQSLLKSALLKPLLPLQQQQVLRELELERRLVVSLDLATDSVPQLVEHNPVIAFEVLVRLIQLGCGKDYLPSLVSMEVSVHSMEVINRLSTAASLPSQFVHLYISNCIRSCQAAQDDKYMQLRRVRLVCVFLQSLIRNHIINVQDLSFEAQAFCIEFSRVREAAALFRLLKTLENGAPTENINQQT